MKIKRLSPILALVLLPACGVLGPTEEHATLEQSPESLEVPASVASVGWNWQPPEDTSIEHVSPTQHGVAVAVGDGVVALAGDTGEEHWHYRRPEEAITSAGVTPDGSKVMVSDASDHTDEEDEDGPPAENEIVLLDSATGDIISQHTTAFDPQIKSGLDSNIHGGNNREPGIIADEALVTQESHEGEHGDIVAHSLEDGTELWRSTPEPDALPKGSSGLVEHGVVVEDTLVLSLLFSSPEAGSLPTEDDPNDYALTLLGLDQNDGSELWRHDTTLLDYADVPQHQMGVDETSGTLFIFSRLDRNSGDEEWLLAPETGEPVTDVDFISVREQDIVGAVDNQIVTAHETDSEDELQYTYEDLSGDTLDRITVDAPLARILNATFIVPLADGLAWLDVNQQGDFSWGPAQVVVADKSTGHSETLDLGDLVVDTGTGNDGTPSQSVFPDPEAMTLAPGALVVQGERESEESTTDELVGIVP